MSTAAGQVEIALAQLASARDDLTEALLNADDSVYNRIMELRDKVAECASEAERIDTAIYNADKAA